MLKAVSLIFVLATVALLAYAATKPDTFSVQRSLRINAPPDKLFALVNDTRAFNSWNPYNRKDPQIRLVYNNIPAGAGASFGFEGNKDVGSGSMAIISSTAPGRVAMKLNMLKPFAASNDIVFTLVPESGGTQITWAMSGASPYIAKVMTLFFSMDKMVGNDFEAGLKNLQLLAEKS